MAIDPDVAAPVLEIIGAAHVIGAVFDRDDKATAGRRRGGRPDDTATRAEENA